MELVGALAFRVDGTGLGFTHNDVMRMTYGEALRWLRYQNRRCEELRQARAK